MEDSGTTWLKNSRRKLAALVVGAAMIAGGLGATTSVDPVESARDAVERKQISAIDIPKPPESWARSTWS